MKEGELLRPRPHRRTLVVLDILIIVVLLLSAACSPVAAPASPTAVPATQPSVAGQATATSASAAPASPTAASVTTAPAASGAAGGRLPDTVGELEALLKNNIYYKAAIAPEVMVTNKGKIFGPGEKPRITFVLEGLSHPHLVRDAEDAKAMGQKLGVDVRVISAEDNPDKQLAYIENTLASGTDALMMFPALTKGLSNVLKQYNEKGIPYFFCTKGMEDVDYTASVLANYYGEGVGMGKWIVDYYAKKGMKNVKTVILRGIPGDLSDDARSGGFKMELLKSGNFQIMAEQPTNYRREPGMKVMETLLAAHPDVQLVFAASDEPALGALAAIRAAGRKDIAIVGLDAEKDIFPEIQNGSILATHTHDPVAGPMIQMIVDYLQGKPIKKLQVTQGEYVVTKELIDAGKAQPSF